MGAGRRMSSEFVPTEGSRRFHYFDQGGPPETFLRFNDMCITAAMLYQYRHCGRPPWGKRKTRDYDHSSRTRTQSLVGMLVGDQCLDDVACEGSRLIPPLWLVCSEILLSSFGRLGMLWVGNTRTIGTTVYPVYNQLGGRLAYRYGFFC